jgi:hypothetical protein
MGKRARESHAATVNYVAEMATELRCAKLAYILEVAALEAKSTAEPAAEVPGRAGGLH